MCTTDVNWLQEDARNKHNLEDMGQCLLAVTSQGPMLLLLENVEELMISKNQREVRGTIALCFNRTNVKVSVHGREGSICHFLLAINACLCDVSEYLMFGLMAHPHVHTLKPSVTLTLVCGIVLHNFFCAHKLNVTCCQLVGNAKLCGTSHLKTVESLVRCRWQMLQHASVWRVWCVLICSKM
jgi:hypothetical protein